MRPARIALGFLQVLVLALILPLALPTPALADPLIPAKRLQLWDNTDLPGGDLASIFDTTLEACERACLSNSKCEALVFNTRNNSCFIKSGGQVPAGFDGAYGGFVVQAEPGAEARAAQRRADLPFLFDWDISSATAYAANLANLHTTNGYSAEEHMGWAHEAEQQGDATMAYRYAGAATVVSDAAADWAEYARLMLAAAETDPNNAGGLRQAALDASVNAYLRSEGKAQRHSVLVTLGQALEKVERGRDQVQALRLAQSIQPRDDTAAALEDAIAKYGFRITDNDVQSDSARPRICATFSEPLDTGADYSSFVQLPDPGLSVALDGDRRLCIEGIQHGARYQVTFREGLPAADGQTLAKSVGITQYIRDRSPGVRFAGRGYVLPRVGEAWLPVETVNTADLDLTLYRVTDRNMLRAIQNGYFSAPIYDYQEWDFQTQIGTEIWTGSATVGQEVNKDISTRLNLTEALAGQAAGIYALKAAVPGVDPYVVPAAWQWFTVSDLGLTTFSGADGVHVVVRALGNAAAKPGVSVQLLSAANEVLGTATTDAQGLASFDAALTRGTGGAAPALIVAKDGADAAMDIAFLSLTDPEFDLSDRGVEGREPAGPIDVFLTTERGAYRAGETVHAVALARDGDARAVEDLPLTAILTRPDGIEYYRALAEDQGAGGHVFDLPIQPTAPRGVWRLAVYADPGADPVAAQTFLVEDFLPDRIAFDLALPDAPLRLGDAPDLTVNAKYLFGAPGADLAVEGEVLLRQADTVAGWDGYVWGHHDQPFSAQIAPFDPARTDAAGQAVIPVALPQVEDPLRPLSARVTVRVAEGSGRPVERRVEKLLTPSAPLIGVKPGFDGVAAEGSDATFQVVGLGPDQKPIPMQAHWTLVKIDTIYQWYQTDGYWNWEPVTTRIPVAEGDLTLADQPVSLAARVDWGEYELRVERSDGIAGGVSTTFWAGWYAPADVSSSPDTLELSLDKPAYLPGETAMLRIVPRAAGTAVISILSNRLVSLTTAEVKEGENLIPLPVTGDWGAGVYVTASVLRPMDVAAGRNPARALGLAYAAVDPADRALKTTLTVPAEAAPRGPLEVAVKVEGVAPGDTAYVTLAAVDQGILNLTAFDPPDPQGHYFGQRKLGVGIRDLYGRLIDGLSGAEGQVRSGGDAGAQARLKGPVPTEDLLAFFTGPVTVGADGMARASFDLPSFNGTVKVMALAWSKRGIGQASADVLVRDPVVVTASLPRFLAPGDESRLLLEIVHATGPTGRMGLDVTGSANLGLGAAPSGVDLAQTGAKARVEIPLKAGDPGDGTIDIALTTPDGKVLRKTLHLTVQVTDAPTVRISRFDLPQGKSFTFDDNALAGLYPGSARATLAIGPIARLNAPGILQALDAYPWGCTEQITSKALPLLYYEQVAQAMDLPGSANIRARVEQSVAQVLLNQGSTGGFGLWAPGEGDMWLDAYVTDFLSRAKAKGYAVPDAAFRQALDNLRNQVNYYSDFDTGGEPLAYALMVLSREGAAAIGDLRYYADVKADAFATPLAQAQLGAALASYGDQPRADAMFAKAVARVQEAIAANDMTQVIRADYGTTWRDAAGVLALGLGAGSTAVDRNLLVPVLARRDGPMSTQEMAWGLLAANALIDTQGTDAVLIDGAPATGPLVRVHAPGDGPVTVQNTGPDTTLTLTAYGTPSEPEPAGGAGYAITRSYFTMDGAPVDLSALKVGDRMVAVIEVTPFARGEARLMVTDPLPAGLEIDNPNLIASGSAAALDWLSAETEVAHSEFRADRFLTAIDRYDNAAFTLAYVVRAVSPGTFHAPAASVQDMYRPDFSAHGDAGTITIAP